MSNVALRMYTIYERPLDYPDHYVVREVLIKRGSQGGEVHMGRLVAVTGDLASARAKVPIEADACDSRRTDDEPHIVETWF